MKIRTALSGILPGVMLLSGLAQASLYDRGGMLIYDGMRNVPSADWRLTFLFYAVVGCAIYVAIIFLLCRFVGFNELDQDR